MTRSHCALCLLALGPLKFREFREITGWPARDCTRTLDYLQETGRVVRDGMWRIA